MRKFAHAACGAAVVALALCCAAIPSARAEMQVLESNVSAYPVGTRLPDNAKLDLQPGERVKVLLLPSNRTKVYAAPPLKVDGAIGGPRGTPKKKTE
jgi:hypothetical protein